MASLPSYVPINLHWPTAVPYSSSSSSDNIAHAEILRLNADTEASQIMHRISYIVAKSVDESRDNII